ncbi:NADH:flavin oxidoreductase [Candidatus Thorarchaeota archaeon]|nr:MAG: NADH:flavin oxidoreductase [Candidatus Thorarchaeota archaeon]
MSVLFDPFKIGSMQLKNRLMRSATTSAFSRPDGTIRPAIVELYSDLAKGGTGLIVKGHLYVLETGKAHEGMAGISDDKHISGLKEITKAVHEHNGKIVAQLNHAGINHKGDRAGPSEYKGDNWQSRALLENEIEEIIDAFGDAAERALQADFDGVQIHGAHGYLISQFLSKLVNTRDDQWGGSLNKRMNLLIRVYDEIRRRVGRVPLLLKLNSDDFSPNGFTIEDSIRVAQVMYEKGIDIIEISGGGIGRRQDLRSRAEHDDDTFSELAFAGHAARIRNHTGSAPMALVNGFRQQKTMQASIERGLVDVVSMSRPFIREPTLVKKLKEGQDEVQCIRCDKCLGEDVFGKVMLQCQLD